MIKKERIIFLDLLRIFALLMMMQGHTFDALLSENLRSTDSIFFNIWYNFRGFTAPVFIFTAGAVFAYLLFSSNGGVNKFRLRKGVKRALILLGIGYLLRYPTYKIFVFNNVSRAQWKTFFAVDALHLIGAGILTVAALTYLVSKRNNLSKYFFLGFGFLIFLLSPAVNNINWTAFLPLPAANYFTAQHGSLFPLFPWMGYIFLGAQLGLLIAEKPDIIKKKNFPVINGLIAIGLFTFYYFLKNPGNDLLFAVEYSLILKRISFIFLLVTFFSMLSFDVKSLPAFLNLIARNSLFIYAGHLIMVYGWVFSPGISKYYYRSLSFTQTLIIFLTIFTIIFGLIYGINKFRNGNKKPRLTAEV